MTGSRVTDELIELKQKHIALMHDQLTLIGENKTLRRLLLEAQEHVPHGSIYRRLHREIEAALDPKENA